MTEEWLKDNLNIILNIGKSCLIDNLIIEYWEPYCDQVKRKKNHNIIINRLKVGWSYFTTNSVRYYRRCRKHPMNSNIIKFITDEKNIPDDDDAWPLESILCNNCHHCKVHRIRDNCYCKWCRTEIFCSCKESIGDHHNPDCILCANKKGFMSFLDCLEYRVEKTIGNVFTNLSENTLCSINWNICGRRPVPSRHVKIGEIVSEYIMDDIRKETALFIDKYGLIYGFHLDMMKYKINHLK